MINGLVYYAEELGAILDIICLLVIKKSTIGFLVSLERNNNRDWFNENRKHYENAKRDFTDLVTEVVDGLRKFEPELDEDKRDVHLYRINRDVRFSKDKTPYNSHFSASITVGGRKSGRAGYFFRIKPGLSGYGGGMYMPETKVVYQIRKAISTDLADFLRILNQKAFVRVYEDLADSEMLKNPPRGFDKADPAIDFLKRKSFFAYDDISDVDIHSSDLTHKIVTGFKLLKPLNDFLNVAAFGR